LRKFLYNPPVLIKKVFSSTAWNTANNKVLLTFDDGPIPETTGIILDILRSNNIKAAFFCVGNNIKKNPGLAEKILSDGHLIGNHTFNHKVLTKAAPEEMMHEINAVNEIMLDEFQYQIKYFRHPHGKFNLKTLSALKKQNLTNVMWSLLTYDYKNDLNIVKFAVKKYLCKDSLIVLHDSIKSGRVISGSIDAVINEVYDKGYEFGVPEECLK
jgi:peptidoglycan/xylan/chitin deacetylase (PgdA/CDA1 family)